MGAFWAKTLFSLRKPFAKFDNTFVVNDDIVIRSGHVVSVTSLHGEHSHSFTMTLKLQEKQSFYISTCNTFPPSI